ncbi:hypothetical protein F8M41_002824 [Gigaspora margarita]|uniref:Uncharacterized protein n=1 Tax=Gigaspora margarita TaxID=4874 RepID=A0A8H4ESB7_GIGMA|nr:hypothetical protein F8M41_002824 [Gigaspora margarita]
MQHSTISNTKSSFNHEVCTSSEYEPFNDIVIPKIQIECENSRSRSEGCNRDGFEIYNSDSGNLANRSKSYNSRFRSNSCNSKIGSYNYNLTIGSGPWLRNWA